MRGLADKIKLQRVHGQRNDMNIVFSPQVHLKDRIDIIKAAGFY